MIQVPTMLFEQIQAWIVDDIFTNGEFKIKVPSMNLICYWQAKIFGLTKPNLGNFHQIVVGTQALRQDFLHGAKTEDHDLPR